MAKKPKHFLHYSLDADFQVHLNPERRMNIQDEIVQNKMSLSLKYNDGDGYCSTSVYPDYIEGGELKFAMLSTDVLQVSVKGSYFQFLDPKWEQAGIDNWKTLGELKVYSNNVSDSEPTSHYINGSEDDYEIGTVSLVQK